MRSRMRDALPVRAAWGLHIGCTRPVRPGQLRSSCDVRHVRRKVGFRAPVEVCWACCGSLFFAHPLVGYLNAGVVGLSTVLMGPEYGWAEQKYISKGS